VVVGIASIVASGGGLEDLFFGPTIVRHPASVTVQAGENASFTVVAQGRGTLTYQWQRAGVDIAGATGSTYTLFGAQLGDDGARFSVVVRDRDGSTSSGSARLAVSSLPGVVFEDREFLPADWSAVVLEEIGRGSTYGEERVDAGGNPGAYRRITHRMVVGEGALTVIHMARAAVYDPAQQGAIHVIDFSEDLSLLSQIGQMTLYSGVVLEQAGRRYVALSSISNHPQSGWQSLSSAALRSTDFGVFDGPPCGTGEACPDFSRSAPPITFGHTRRVYKGSGASDALIHGIDNWKVTVWRK
jgi:hypothetical protein